MMWMMRMNMVYVLVVLQCAIIVRGSMADDSSNRCRSLGFDESTLQCSQCTKFLSSLKLPELVKECLTCCADDSGTQHLSRKFSEGTFIVCSCRFRSNKELETLVEERIPAAYPSIKVQYVEGYRMELKMRSRDGEETVFPLEKWAVKDIEAFLDQKLESDVE